MPEVRDYLTLSGMQAQEAADAVLADQALALTRRR